MIHQFKSQCSTKKNQGEMKQLLSFLILLLACRPAHGIDIGGFVDYKGFRYQLANTTVDIDDDFSEMMTGNDDCTDVPCPYFDVPPTCNASYPTTDVRVVAMMKNWGSAYIAGPGGLYSIFTWLPSPVSYSLLDLSVPGKVALTEPEWKAHILLRCIIPCLPGTYLVGSSCVTLNSTAGDYQVNTNRLKVWIMILTGRKGWKGKEEEREMSILIE